MADITIVDTADSSRRWPFSSAKRRTVAQVLDTIGDGTLVHPDGDMMVRDDYLDAPGTYGWTGKANADRKRPASEISSSPNILSISNDSEIEEVYGILKTEAEKLQNLYHDDDYCDPCEVSATWKEDEIREELQKRRKEIMNFLANNEAKSPRVLAQRLGTGCGKSHILVNAHEMLGAENGGVYITYNLGQSLSIDVSDNYSRKSVLIRVALMCLGSSNKGCDVFLVDAHTKVLLDLDLAFLRNLAIYSLKMYNRGNPVVVAVDEARELDDKKKSERIARTMISELGEIVYSLYTQNIECVVIASSLEHETFSSLGGRKPHWIDSPKVDDSALDFLVEKLLLASHHEQIPLIRAVSGLHFRSMVQAIKTVNAGTVSEVTVPILMQTILQKLHDKLSDKEKTSVRDYVKNRISEGASAGDAEKFTDSVGAVAPSLIWASFEGENRPAKQIFNTSACVSKEKQLELIGYEYDMFRAQEGLPFLPFGVTVHNTKNKNSLWYQKLRFDPNIQKSDCSIFETEVKGRERNVVRSETALDTRCYYLPQNPAHPWIDRACFCYHEDSQKVCLVLYQDKINHDLGTAVKNLNDAGNVFVAEYPDYAILCVAHIAGASLRTRAQNDFKHPYILIRESEIEAFYSLNFAPAVRFVRLRYTKGV